jgi:hypothetical protein
LESGGLLRHPGATKHTLAESKNVKIEKGENNFYRKGLAEEKMRDSYKT